MTSTYSEASALVDGAVEPEAFADGEKVHVLSGGSRATASGRRQWDEGDEGEQRLESVGMGGRSGEKLEANASA